MAKPLSELKSTDITSTATAGSLIISASSSGASKGVMYFAGLTATVRNSLAEVDVKVFDATADTSALMIAKLAFRTGDRTSKTLILNPPIRCSNGASAGKNGVAHLFVSWTASGTDSIIYWGDPDWSG